MKQLTPDQFLRQIRNLGNKFDAEIFRAKQDIGRYATNHFKSSFARSGFAGGREKWAKREHSYNHAILDKSGKLKESLNFRVMNTSDKIVIMTVNPYSQFHNDPTGTWRRNQYTDKATIQRQFMGNSTSLELWIKKRLETALKNTFN